MERGFYIVSDARAWGPGLAGDRRPDSGASLQSPAMTHQPAAPEGATLPGHGLVSRASVSQGRLSLRPAGQARTLCSLPTLLTVLLPKIHLIPINNEHCRA